MRTLIYEIREAKTNSEHALVKGSLKSTWTTYREAALEIERLYTETGKEYYIASIYA